MGLNLRKVDPDWGEVWSQDVEKYVLEDRWNNTNETIGVLYIDHVPR